MKAIEWVNNWKRTNMDGMKWWFEYKEKGLSMSWDIMQHLCRVYRDGVFMESQTTPRGTLPQYLQYIERNYGRA